MTFSNYLTVIAEGMSVSHYHALFSWGQVSGKMLWGVFSWSCVYRVELREGGVWAWVSSGLHISNFWRQKVTVLKFSVLWYYLCFSSPISTSFHLDLAVSFSLCCGELHHTYLKPLQDFSSCTWVLRKTVWFIAWAMSYWVSVVLWSKVMLSSRHRIQTTPWAIYNFRVYGNYVKVKIKRWN